MAWAFSSVSGKSSPGTGSQTLSWPAGAGGGAGAGNTVFLFCCRGFGAGLTWSATGFTTLVSRNANDSSAILYRVLDGTEGASISVNQSGSGGAATYFSALFTGGPSSGSFASSIVGTSTTGHNATGLLWDTLSIPSGNDGCLVLVLATKQASLTSYNVPSAWDAEIQHSVTSDSGQSFVADYKIQSVAANITSGSWTVTGDTSAIQQNLLAAILPASSYVPYPPMSLGGIGVQMCQ